jgi:hypothetical protein
MNRLVSVFFGLFAAVSFAQESLPVELKGRVDSFMPNLEGIYVVNLKTEKTAITDENGDFSILAMIGDTIMFSALQIKRKHVVLSCESFAETILNVKMQPLINQLDEVIVRSYNNINAVSLGIIPANQRSYTPAERKYATASSARLNPMGLDPIINLLSGRTAMLRKEMKVEKKESYIAMLENMFDKEHFINTLRLPLDYIKGFEYYVVDNDKFTRILDQKNKTTIEFLLGELANKYKDIIACENE